MTHYATLSVTDYYGPETRYAILSWHDTAEAARAAAEAHDPDYDATVDCCRVGHNQASPTRGEVYRQAAINVEEYEVEEYEADGKIVVLDEDAGWLVALEKVG